MDLRTDSAREELVVLTKLSLPVISTNLLAYLLQVVGQVFLGRLGASISSHPPQLFFPIGGLGGGSARIEGVLGVEPPTKIFFGEVRRV